MDKNDYCYFLSNTMLFLNNSLLLLVLCFVIL